MNDSPQMGLMISSALQPAGRAKISATPASEKASGETEVLYSEKSLDWLATFDPATSSWKTCQLCLPGITEGGLEVYSQPLPPSGTMRNGTLYRLAPLRDVYLPERHTAALESGLWPTPTSRDYKDTGDCENVEENCLLGRAVQPSKEKGSLSPTWTAWLMGLPLDWLDLNGWKNPELADLPKKYLTEFQSFKHWVTD